MIKRLLVLIFVSVILIFPYPVSALQISTSFSPASISGVAGADIVTDIKISPDSTITAQNFTINASFNTASLEIKAITYLSPWSKSTNLGGQGTADKDQINITGSMNLSGENLDPDGVAMAVGPVSVVRLTFTVKNTTQSAVNILSSSSINVVGQDKIVQSIPLSSSALTVNPTAPPTPTPTASVCSNLSLPGAGLTPGPDNPSGGKSYTVLSTGATSSISVTRVPADASVAFTPTTASGSGQLTITPFTDGTGWSLTIPPNTSTTANSYTLAASVTTAGGQASCNPVTLTVSASTLPVCTYSSTQVLFRKRSQDSWLATGAVSANQPIFIAAFHNGNFGTLPADTALSITDPEFQSVTIPTGNNVTFTPTKVGTYVISATTPGSTGNACVGSLNLTVEPATVYTKSFRIAESPFVNNNDLTSSDWQPYTGHPMALTHTLSSPLKKGDVRTIFIQFLSSENRPSAVFQKTITYSPDPRITNLNCHQSATGVGTAITIKGTNFGPRGNNGKVKVGGNDIEEVNWNDQTNTIELTLPQRLEGRIPVVVTIDDGRSVTANCSIGITFVEFETRTQCKLPGQFAADNVEVKVFEVVPGSLNPEPIQRQKIRFDKDGKPQGFAPKFEKGKNYALVMKGPGALARKVEFKAEAGTTILDPISLPVGDIAPANSPDGKINALDKSELIRQWSLITDVARSGDFNGDSRINSIDYACMRQNFNQSDEVYTPPAPTPSPSPRVSPPAESSASASEAAGLSI